MSLRDQLQHLPDLAQHLQDLLRQIPQGRVTTHGALAAALGSPAASRWVGHYILHHPHRPECVCHRVVRADGTLGGYVSGNGQDKARALEADGVACTGARVDLTGCGFAAFQSAAPLRQLEQLQQELRSRLDLSGHRDPHQLAGVDVSYRGDWACAAYVEIDATTRHIAWSLTTQRRVDFPYISSYLAFRELPVLLDLLAGVQAVHPLADVLLVDGSGIAHPRQMGLATMLGIAANLSTIGVTKKLLCGQVDLNDMGFGQMREIRCAQQGCLGFATLPWPRSRRPIFVSPGHRVSVEQTACLLRSQLGARRLPDAIYWADQLSRGVAHH